MLKNKFIENRKIPTIGDNIPHKCERHKFCTLTAISLIQDRTVLDYIYIKPQKINSREHLDEHNINDIKDYYENIIPVIVKKQNDEFKLDHDGNHRVNTIKSLGLDVPAYLIEND